MALESAGEKRRREYQASQYEMETVGNESKYKQ